jgi:hypothetical protein
MSYYSQQELNKILANKPAGVSDQEIIDGLKARGHQIEGQNAQAAASPQPQSTPNQLSYSGGRGLLQKAAGFLGIEKAGQGLATAYRTATGENKQTVNQNAQSLQDTSKIIQALNKLPKGDPRRQSLLSQLKQSASGNENISEGQIDAGTNLSNREVAGSFANVGLNALAGGSVQGLKYGGMVAQNAPRVANVLNDTARVINSGGKAVKAGKVLAEGAAFGLAGGLNNNEDNGQLVSSAVLGAASNGVIGLAGKGIGKIKEIATDKLPEYLMNQAVKPALNDLKKNVRYGTDTLGKELVQEGVKGSAKGLLKISDRELTANENKLQSVLKNSTGIIKRDDIAPYLQATIDRLKATPGATENVSIYQSILNDLPEQFSVAKGNEFKRNLYSELRDVAYKIDPSLSKKKEAMKILASGLKSEIENKSGQPDIVRALNKKLSIYGRLEDSVVDGLARSNRKRLIGLQDTILASAGITHPLAFATILGRHLSTSTRVLTNSAVGLNAAKNIETGTTGKIIKKGTKRLLQNAVNR